MAMDTNQNNIENDIDSYMSLHEMFQVVGDQMTPRDVTVLKYIYSGIMSKDMMSKVNDGYTFLCALEAMDKVDKTCFKHILDLLRIITRHDLTPYVTLKRRKTVITDPVTNFLESVQAESKKQEEEQNQAMKSRTKRRKRRSFTFRKSHKCQASSSKSETQNNDAVMKESLLEIKPRVTCDIKLRVRAEYASHDHVLANVGSAKQTELERQLERFAQADTILKARDIGSIVCDIKFSELTYLDAFWRDYINGSLLEALKGVFITDSLKAVIGQEAVKLCVSVDEDDYESGRLKLLQNLRP